MDWRRPSKDVWFCSRSIRRFLTNLGLMICDRWWSCVNQYDRFTGYGIPPRKKWRLRFPAPYPSRSLKSKVREQWFYLTVYYSEVILKQKSGKALSAGAISRVSSGYRRTYFTERVFLPVSSSWIKKMPKTARHLCHRCIQRFRERRPQKPAVTGYPQNRRCITTNEIEKYSRYGIGSRNWKKKEFNLNIPAISIARNRRYPGHRSPLVRRLPDARYRGIKRILGVCPTLKKTLFPQATGKTYRQS